MNTVINCATIVVMILLGALVFFLVPCLLLWCYGVLAPVFGWTLVFTYQSMLALWVLISVASGLLKGIVVQKAS